MKKSQKMVRDDNFHILQERNRKAHIFTDQKKEKDKKACRGKVKDWNH